MKKTLRKDKRNLLKGLGITFLLSSLSLTNVLAFSDVSSESWYSETVDVLTSEYDVIKGYEDGSFRPEDKLSVEQFVTLVCRSFGLEFTATDGEHWSKPYMDYATEKSWINEEDYTREIQSNIYDGIDGEISRSVMAKVIVEALEDFDDTIEYRNKAEVRKEISDYLAIPSDYKDYVVKVYDLGIITGYEDGSFKGQYYDTLSRAEGATVIHRLLDESYRRPADISPLSQTLVIDEETGYYVNQFGDKFKYYDEFLPIELYTDYPLYETSLGTKDNATMIDNGGFVNEAMMIHVQKIGESYVDTFFNVDYREVAQDKEQYLTDVRWHFNPITQAIDRSIESPEYTQNWVDFVVDNNVDIDFNFESSHKVMYSIGGDLTMRGKGTYTINSCDDIETLKTFAPIVFGGDIEVGKTYEVVFDTYIQNRQRNEGWEYATDQIIRNILVDEVSEVK